MCTNDSFGKPERLRVTDANGHLVTADTGFWNHDCEIHIDSPDPAFQSSTIKLSELCENTWCNEIYLNVDLAALKAGLRARRAGWRVFGGRDEGSVQLV